MRSHLLHISLAMFVVVSLLRTPIAVDKGQPNQCRLPPRGAADRDEDDYRQFFKKPTNTAEFWKALQFEIDVGKYDLAAVHLRNLIASSRPTPIW